MNTLFATNKLLIVRNFGLWAILLCSISDVHFANASELATLNLQLNEELFEPDTDNSLFGESIASLSSTTEVAAIVVAVALGAIADNMSGPNGHVNTTEGAYGAEYNYQSMLSAIKPLELNNYGYDGSGVKVAVVDSGIDASHPEFSGKTILGHDFAGSASGYTNDEHGHGTHVASIIAANRDATGMRGVAYDSTLYSYKLDNNGDIAFEALSLGDAYRATIFERSVTDNIDVSNNSWGIGVTLDSTWYTRSLQELTITAAKAAQDNGTLFVFASGNSGQNQPSVSGGLPYLAPELKDAWLLVVSVNSSLGENAYGNRCGKAYDFCVAAPGGGDSRLVDGIRAAEANTAGYVRFSGTSMAAPHVSGLAAALMEKFPNLTPDQIATRIKATASLDNLTGYYGETLATHGEATMRAIFGYGLVDGGAAASAIGGYIYPVDGALSDGVDLRTTYVSLPTGVSASVVRQIMNDKFVVFDSFDNAQFTVSGKEVFESKSSSFVPSYDLENLNTPPVNSFVGRLSYNFSDTGGIDAANHYWGAKSSFFEPVPFTLERPEHKFSWTTSFSGVAVTPFVKSKLTSTDSDGLSEYGIALASNLNSGTGVSFAYSKANELLDFGLTKRDYVEHDLGKLQLGLISSIAPKQSVFARYARTNFSDIGSTVNRLGIQAAAAESINFGYELGEDQKRYTVGLKSDYALTEGKVSVLSPSGMNKSGTIFFGHKDYQVEREYEFDPYFAFVSQAKRMDWGFSASLNGEDLGQLQSAQFNIKLSL